MHPFLCWSVILTRCIGYFSSAVIILTLVFINAESLDFKQADGIIIGVNIGTTFSSQIIALDVAQSAMYPMLFGLARSIFLRCKMIRLYVSILLYFGILFFGLYIVGESVRPQRNSNEFLEWIARIENNHLQGAVSGGIIALIVQPSSIIESMAIVPGK